MTDAEKLATLKSILNIGDTTSDDLLNVYLSMAQKEILNWMYINYGDVPSGAEMPSKYEITQINAVVAGFNLRGGENELKHVENGITREFNHPDMVSYIRTHVFQLVKT